MRLSRRLLKLSDFINGPIWIVNMFPVIGEHSSPSHMYSLHPYRMMPSYCSPLPNSTPGLAPQNSWGIQPPPGEKMEPPFFYPTWNQDSQLRLPIPCDGQSFSGKWEVLFGMLNRGNDVNDNNKCMYMNEREYG